MAPEPLRILYVSGSRAAERKLLAACEPAVEWWEIALPATGGARWARGVGALHTLVRSRRPDAALFEYAGLASLPGLLVCRSLRIPYALRVKGDPWREAHEAGRGLSARSRLKKRLRLAAFRFGAAGAERLLPLTPALAERCASQGLLQPLDVVPLPAPAVPERPSVPAAPPVLLTVTNFAFRPKVAPLLAALPGVCDAVRTRGWRWVVAGGGRHLDEFRTAAARAGGPVEVLGSTDPLPRYAEATAFLYFTGLDGLPTVLLEAAAHALPIAANAGSPAAAFLDGVGGGRVIAADGGTRAVRDAVLAFLDDAAAGRAGGEQTRAGMLRDYAPAAVAGKLLGALHATSRTAPRAAAGGGGRHR